jgi:hypothetical protein
MQPAGVVILAEGHRVGLFAAVEEVEGEQNAVDEVKQM